MPPARSREPRRRGATCATLGQRNRSRASLRCRDVRARPSGATDQRPAGGMLLAPSTPPLRLTAMSINTDETVARAGAADASVDRKALERAFLDKLFSCRASSRRRHAGTTTTWRSPTRCATGCSALDQHRRGVHGQRVAHRVCYLSAEFLLGSAPRQQPAQPRLYDQVAPGDGRPRPRPRRAARAGRGAGPRQRRPRPARRLLHGLARDARDPGDRLRHPLRVRHLRPGDPRRLAGRAHRQVAALRQPVGDRAPGDRRSTVRLGGRTERYTDEHGATACAGFPSASSTASPYDTPILGYRVNTANMLRLWSAEARGVVRLRGVQRRRLLRRGRAEGRCRRTSRRCSTRTTSRSQGKQLRLEQQYFFVSCSLQDMIRIYCRAAADRSSASTRSSRSSSTTRTRRSRSPS